MAVRGIGKKVTLIIPHPLCLGVGEFLLYFYYVAFPDLLKNPVLPLKNTQFLHRILLTPKERIKKNLKSTLLQYRRKKNCVIALNVTEHILPSCKGSSGK